LVIIVILTLVAATLFVIWFIVEHGFFHRFPAPQSTSAMALRRQETPLVDVVSYDDEKRGKVDPERRQTPCLKLPAFPRSSLAQTDLHSPEDLPPLPSPATYVTPRARGSRLGPGETDQQRARREEIEDSLADWFRLDGYHRAMSQLTLLKSVEKIRLLHQWLALNQHIPPVYLIFGTRECDPK
jgi:hypothetical protein